MDKKYETPTGFTLHNAPATESELKHFNLSCSTLPFSTRKCINDIETLRDFSMYEVVGSMQQLLQRVEMIQPALTVYNQYEDTNVFLGCVLILNALYGYKTLDSKEITEVISELALRAAQHERVIVFDECVADADEWIYHLRAITKWDARIEDIKTHFQILPYDNALKAIADNTKKVQEENRKLSTSAKEVFRQSCINFRDWGVSTDMLSNRKDDWICDSVADFWYKLMGYVGKYVKDTKFTEGLCPMYPSDSLQDKWPIVLLVARNPMVSDAEIVLLMLSLLYFSAKLDNVVVVHHEKISSLGELREVVKYIHSKEELFEFTKQLFTKSAEINLPSEKSAQPSDCEQLAVKFNSIYSQEGMTGVVQALMRAVSTMPEHGIKDNFSKLLCTALNDK